MTPYREETTRSCHICKLPMTQLNHDANQSSVVIERCETCKYSFFDAGELALVTSEGASLEAKLADYSNPQLHCEQCQESILETKCQNIPDRRCPSCDEALFIVYATPCDLEYCRKCKSVLVRDDTLQAAIKQEIELSRVQLFTEEEKRSRQIPIPQTKRKRAPLDTAVFGVFEIIGLFFG